MRSSSRYPLPEKPRQKRAVIQDMVRPLKQWLLRHRHNPYPTKAEKVQLALGSNMTLVQVCNLILIQRGALLVTDVKQRILELWIFSTTETTLLSILGFELVRQCPSAIEERGTGASVQLVQATQDVQPIRSGKRRTPFHFVIRFNLEFRRR